MSASRNKGTNRRENSYQRLLCCIRKLVTIAIYGRECACCGESYPDFLTVDHIAGGGSQHRRKVAKGRSGTEFYKWLERQRYPEGFQVLCWNCNCAKHLNNGTCPHILPSRKEYSIDAELVILREQLGSTKRAGRRILDEFSDLLVSGSRKSSLRRRKDRQQRGLCLVCDRESVNKNYCARHRNEYNQRAREMYAKRSDRS